MGPDLVAGDRVQSHDTAPARDVHDAVMDQRGHFVSTGRRLPRPDQLQVLDVASIDLIEWAIALTVECPTPVDPVTRGWVEQFGISDRFEVSDLGLDDGGESAHETCRDDQNQGR